ncbi:MAG: hypothetical protein CR979_01780 [Propionibacterium sp.]|nr:MAG: hypothetical protein CR979_01780 [Propionibacterium sp.]
MLGCTHYPLLSGVISYVMGDNVTLISSADEGAHAAYTALTKRDLIHAQPRDATRTFLTTGNAADFEGVGRRLMGGFIADVRTISLN